MSDRMQKQAMQKFFNYMRAYSYPYKSYNGVNSFYQQGMSAEGSNKDADKQKKSQTSQYMPYGYPSYNPYSMPYPPQSFSMEASAQAARLQAESKNKSQVGYGSTNPNFGYYPYYSSYNPYGIYSSYYFNQRSQSLPERKQQKKQVQLRPQNISEPPQIKILSKPVQKAPIIKQQIVISSDSEQIIPQKPTQNYQKQNNQPLSKNIFSQKDSKPISQKRPNNMEVIIQQQPDAFYIRKKMKNQKQAERAMKMQKEKHQKSQRQKALKAQKAEKMQKEKALLKNQRLAVLGQKQEKQQNNQSEKAIRFAKTKNISRNIIKGYPNIFSKERYNTMPAQAYQQMLKKQSRQSLQMFHQRQKQRELEQLIGRQQKQNEKQADKNNYKYSYLQPEKRLSQQKMVDQKYQRDLPKKQQRQSLKKQQRQTSQRRQQKEMKREQKKPIIPTTIPLLLQEKQAKKERIRDDHPLKQLRQSMNQHRYNQSHGRIRLGIYFQSNIPSLMRNEGKILDQLDLCMRRLELQRKLRERQVSAVTF